jgi:ATP-binding protein involved in chromosome partitioning
MAVSKVAEITLAVASGKGGVGKSTVSLNLAVALAERGHRVGLLDADLYGPDIPRMIGLARTQTARYLDLWSAKGAHLEPLDAFGIKFMSVGFLIGESQSISLQAGLVEVLLVKLVTGVSWGDLEFLIVDLPPGTADVQQQLMQQVRPDGVVLVVTPQDVAHLDAKKVIDLCRRSDVVIAGAIENMSGLVCPCCGEQVDVFPRVAPERAIWEMGVESLGVLPVDPEVATSGDLGRPILVARPDSPQSEAFRTLADKLASKPRSAK